MKRLKLTPHNHSQITSQAVKTLKQNGLIIYPTETCYGAGVDPTSQTAVNKLLVYKSKRQGKPISIAVNSQAMAQQYVNLNSTAKNLYHQFLPGPLTVISKSKAKVANQVESDTNTLGIRIPDYPLIAKLIKQFNRPITATSANASYQPRPYSISSLLKHLSKKQQNLIDLIIDAGPLPKNPPSTVVDTTLDEPLTLRSGPIQLPTATQILTTTSPSQTSDLAKKLIQQYWRQLARQPLIFLLIGNLGAGKTQFCQGIGSFLNIKQPITSPTYTILKEYPFQHQNLKGKFLHLDTWRLQSLAELNQLKLKSQLQPQTILAVEWASRSLKPLLELAQQTQAQTITIQLKPIKNQPQHRHISILT